MSKLRITNYTFNASAKTIAFNNYPTGIPLDGILGIINATTNQNIYQPNNPLLGGSLTGNILTLDIATAGMSNTDELIIYYDEYLQRTLIGNTQKRFRDGFVEMVDDTPDPLTWDYSNPLPTKHIVTKGGNSSGSNYLRISLSPFDVDSEVSITSKDIFNPPYATGFGTSISQRVLGQEVGIEMVGVSDSNVVETITPVTDVAMPVSVTVAVANTIPIVFATPHSYHGGDRIVIWGCLDSRINGGPLVITVVDSLTISVSLTAAVATYATTGGFISWADPLAYAKNGMSLLFENATATNASFVARRNGSSFKTLNSTVITTVATQTNTSPYTDAFNSANSQELYLKLEETSFRSFASDGLTSPVTEKFTQAVPDEEVNYKIRVRAKNLKNMTVPVARIVTIDKTGTTTATVTTDVDHGLTTSDFIQIYGVLDQAAASFPNLSTAVVVTGTPTSNTFTCVIGTAATVSSVGGVVWRVQGTQTAPGVVAGSIQSISRTNNILSVVNGSTWATPLPGEYFQIWGLQGGASASDGAYKVSRVSTTTLELESVGDNFASIPNTGGCGFRRTDIRVHFVRLLDYTRLNVEIQGGRGNSTDMNNAVPVNLTGGTVTTMPNVVIGSGTVTTVSTVTSMTDQANIGGRLANMMIENNSAQDWGLRIRSLL